MKTTVKHTMLSLFFITTTICLHAQAIPTEQNFQQLSNTLTNKQQSSYELGGFEGRAMQKVQELAEYIEIISNKEFDLKFREHAVSLALKLFYEGDVKISNSDNFLSSFNVLEINKYLDTILKTGYGKIVVEISNQQYLENLSQSKSDAYSGKLIFDQTNYYYKNKDVQDKKIENKEVDIILVKTDKQFGKKTKSVWNVYLGDIRTIKK